MNGQLQSILRQLSISQRIGIVFAAVGSVAAILVLVMFASKPDYTPAFTSLTPADASALSSALRSANIQFELADAGTTILVPVGSLSAARVAAADSGVTTSGSGTKGYELFDNTGFGMSQFDQEVTYQRAIEGELTKTIQSMEGVSTARVAIVLAEKGVLSDQDTPASASVVLSMKGGGTPGGGLVQAVVNTVANSVSGLNASNVVVTDDKGHVLAGASDSTGGTAAQAQDAVEQDLKYKIKGLIDQALGAGHASVAVSAQVDTNKVEQEITTYTPVTQGNVTPVSVHQITETYGNGAGTNACGIAGSGSNLPNLPTYPGVCLPAAAASPAASAGASASPSASASPAATPSANASASAGASASAAAGNYIRHEETVNYNLSQTVQHVVQTPGVVKRLSVAVLVDQSALGSLTADTLKNSISAAIGADDTRGDVVSISAVKFASTSTSASASAGGTASGSGDIVSTISDLSGTIIGIIFALVMLVLFWLNSSALRRRAEETALDLGPASAALMAPQVRGALPEGAVAQAAIPAEMPEPTPQARIQQRLQMVADEKPDALVGLMHGWLREEERRR